LDFGLYQCANDPSRICKPRPVIRVIAKPWIDEWSADFVSVSTHGMGSTRGCTHVVAGGNCNDRKNDPDELCAHVKREPPPSFTKGPTIPRDENSQWKQQQSSDTSTHGVCD
jgi:hypothetical protein